MEVLNPRFLKVIDEVREWGVQDRPVLSDSGYGDAYEFRHALRSRELDYVAQVSGGLPGWTEDPHPAEPPMKPGGRIPRKRLYPEELPRPEALVKLPPTSLLRVGRRSRGEKE